MRKSIRYLFSTVGLVALLTGYAQDRSSANSAIPVPLRSELQGPSPLAVLSSALEKEGYSLDWSRAKSGTHDGLTATTLPLLEVAGQIVIGEQGGEVVYTQLSLFQKEGQLLKDWPVCHRSPGSANTYTIYLSYSVASAYLARHGNSLGFCGEDAMSADANSTYIVFTADNPPLTGRTTYDAQGNPIVEEAGESLGTTTLEALTTVKPLPPIEKPDTGLAEFTDFLRETLGDEAEPFLEKIPASMGGTGPEISSAQEERTLEELSAPTEEAPLGVAAGTLNYSYRLGASFMFVFNLDAAPPPEGFEVQIFGPRGWNGGDPARRTFRYNEAGRHATWVNIFRDNDGNSMEAVSGPYIVQADIDGETRRAEVELDTSALLPKPTDLIISEESPSSVSASWTAVSGAASYLVELFETDTGSLDENVTLYTTTPEVTLDELNLTVGGEYRLGVTAMPVDFTAGATKTLPQGQFNTSFVSQRFTVPAE